MGQPGLWKVPFPLPWCLSQTICFSPFLKLFDFISDSLHVSEWYMYTEWFVTLGLCCLFPELVLIST